MKNGITSKIILCIIISFVIFAILSTETTPTETTPTEIQPTKILPIAIKSIETTISKNEIIKPDESQTKRLNEELQEKRLTLINRLIREGIFDRIEMPGTLPHLWVGPTFTNLDFKTKSSFVEVVYAYYFDKPDRKQIEIWGDSVRIYDMYTGKEIGSYGLGNWGSPLKLK